MKGFSESNLRYVRRLAEAWPSEDAIRQQPIGELPWSHTIQLLDKLDHQQLRDWVRGAGCSGWVEHVCFAASDRDSAARTDRGCAL